MALWVLWSWSWIVAASVTLATICIALRNQNLSIASLPIIGDTVLFLRGPHDFLLERFARCGDMFTVSSKGKRILVVNSPEAIKFVLSTAHASFSDGHSEQFKQLVDEGKFIEPGRHPFYRKAVLGTVMGEGLQSLIPFINSLAQKTVNSWENQPVVNTIEEGHKFVFKVAMHVLWRDPDMNSEEMEQIRNEMLFISGAITAVPINFPGFYFHGALKTRKVLKSRIQKAISKRRESRSEVNDVLNAFLSIKEFEVPDYDICCMMTGTLVAASATTSAFIPWVLKYLHDFPEVRQRVQDEQDSIRQQIAEDKSLSWFKLKNSMPYTLQVINEILRIESLAIFVPRRANKDVEYNDFVFHKGSIVWASTTSVHHDPEYYPDPWKFDPSRFEEKPKPNTFMVFGQGPRLCPGSDLSMLETMLLIHHLITNYSWERCGPVEGVTHLPIRRLVGFPIRLVKRHTS